MLVRQRSTTPSEQNHHWWQHSHRRQEEPRWARHRWLLEADKDRKLNVFALTSVVSARAGDSSTMQLLPSTSDGIAIRFPNAARASFPNHAHRRDTSVPSTTSSPAEMVSTLGHALAVRLTSSGNLTAPEARIRAMLSAGSNHSADTVAVRFAVLPSRRNSLSRSGPRRRVPTAWCLSQTSRVTVGGDDALSRIRTESSHSGGGRRRVAGDDNGELSRRLSTPLSGLRPVASGGQANAWLALPRLRRRPHQRATGHSTRALQSRHPAREDRSRPIAAAALRGQQLRQTAGTGHGEGLTKDRPCRRPRVLTPPVRTTSAAGHDSCQHRKGEPR